MTSGCSECPENCEWHEIGHHVGYVFRIAVVDGPACAGRVNHAGWLNRTTCDSLLEGWPSFLATLASLDLDAGRNGGYATPDYSVFGSLELNRHFPWSSRLGTSGALIEDEDMAVPELLWDLADDTPTEELRYYPTTATGVALGSGLRVTKDTVAIGGPSLARLLQQYQPETIADLHESLAGDVNVAAAVRGSVGRSRRRWRPGREPARRSLRRTRVPHRETRARHGQLLPGRSDRADAAGLGAAARTPPYRAAARRVDQARQFRLAPAIFEISVTVDGVASVYDVEVPAGGIERWAWRCLRTPASGSRRGRSSPGCAPETDVAIRIRLSAPGTAARELTGCEYQHLVVAAVDGIASSCTGRGNPRLSVKSTSPNFRSCPHRRTFLAAALTAPSPRSSSCGAGDAAPRSHRPPPEGADRPVPFGRLRERRRDRDC